MLFLIFKAKYMKYEALIDPRIDFFLVSIANVRLPVTQKP